MKKKKFTPWGTKQHFRLLVYCFVPQFNYICMAVRGVYCNSILASQQIFLITATVYNDVEVTNTLHHLQEGEELDVSTVQVDAYHSTILLSQPVG